MNVLSKEDHFHKINYNKLSILDNKPVLYCIVLYCIVLLYGNQQIDLTFILIRACIRFTLTLLYIKMELWQDL